VNRLFRWGIIIALLILIGSGLMAIKLIFVEDKDVEVPSIVGLSLVEAASKLRGVGLVARPDTVDSDQPRDIVIHQSVPSGEKAAKGNIINLKVSRGGALIQIPDVRGMEFAEAVRALDTSGLKLGGVLRVPDQLKPAGVVIAQNPAYPAGVISSRMVELLVSEGKTGRAQTVQVPDIRGRNEDMARQILEQSELNVSRVVYIESKLVPFGSVERTQPNAGSRVQSGASITLYVAKAPAQTPREETPQSLGGAERVSVQNQNDGQVSSPTPTPVQQVPPPVLPVDQMEPVLPVQQTTVPVIPEPASPPAGTQPASPAPLVNRKAAKLSYQVPPLSRPLSLKIEISDADGTRVLRDQQANGGEYISIEAPYSGSANVKVHLGGELIWQEKYD
jgi:serine/threonine-protein kinase